MGFFIVRDNLDTTYAVINKRDKPIGDNRANHYLVHGPDIDLKYAKAELIDDEIVISKDQDIEDANDLQLAKARQSMQFLRNIVWADVTTAADRKEVMRHQTKVLLRIARMLKDQ